MSSQNQFAVQSFAKFATEFNKATVSHEVWHHAQRAVIDWYASLYPGLKTESVRILEKTLVEDLDRGASTLGNGRSAERPLPSVEAPLSKSSTRVFSRIRTLSVFSPGYKEAYQSMTALCAWCQTSCDTVALLNSVANFAND